MLSIGLWELSLVAIVTLLVLGPDKLPQLAQTLAKGIRYTKQLRSIIQREIDQISNTSDNGHKD